MRRRIQDRAFLPFDRSSIHLRSRLNPSRSPHLHLPYRPVRSSETSTPSPKVSVAGMRTVSASLSPLTRLDEESCIQTPHRKHPVQASIRENHSISTSDPVFVKVSERAPHPPVNTCPFIQGVVESHTRTASQPWSPTPFADPQQTSNRDYPSWNQPTNPSSTDSQQYASHNQRSGNGSSNPYSSSQQHFTDL